MKPIAAEIEKSSPARSSAIRPPPTANGMPASASRPSRSGIEQAVQQHEDQEQRYRHRSAAAPGGFQIVELARPDHPVPGRQRHRVGNAPVRLCHRAAEIAAAHAELDRDVALLAALAVDERCAGIERDVGEVRSTGCRRWIPMASGRRLDLAHRVDALAEFRVEPNHHAELPVALQHRGGVGAAERGLHHGRHVAGVEAVARGLPG